MHCIIAGSRSLHLPGYIRNAVRLSGFNVTRVISGHAGGIDSLGEAWADYHGIPCDKYPADWNKYGKPAGPIRNSQMAIIAAKAKGGLIAIWDGKSRGTKDMIDKARKWGLRVYVYLVRN